MTHGQELKQRIDEATNLAYRLGPIDGDHHKAWVIQQMVKTINGWTDEELANWLGTGDDERERGIAP